MIKVDNKFSLKQVVYLKTDEDQRPRIVTAIVIKPNDVLYELSCGPDASEHFDFEISTEKDLGISTHN